MLNWSFDFLSLFPCKRPPNGSVTPVSAPIFGFMIWQHSVNLTILDGMKVMATRDFDLNSNLGMTIADRNSIVLFVLWGSQKELMWWKERKKKRKMIREYAASQGKDTLYVLRANSHVVSPKRLLDMILAHDIPSSIPWVMMRLFHVLSAWLASAATRWQCSIRRFSMSHSRVDLTLSQV